MATIINTPRKGESTRQAIGEGVSNFITKASEGYQTRADEMALQKSVGDLGPNASPQDILNAIAGTHTYGKEAKQNAFKNSLGAAEFKEKQRAAKAKEEIADLKKTQEAVKEKKKQDADMNDALTLIDGAKISHEEKEMYREKIKNGEASFNAIKEVLKPNKQDIKAKEEEQSQKLTQKSFNELADIISDVGRSGYITSKFGGDTAKAYSKFTSLTGALEALLVEKVNRGALSNARFDYITKDLLPKPSDSQKDIEGKLEGLAIVLGLDASKLTGKTNTEAQPQGENKRPPLTAFEK
jgi:hypothetical protein